jgi:hypothetical protein
MTAQITTNLEVTIQTSRPLARHLPKMARVLMGLSFLGAGLFGLAIATGLLAPPQPPAPQPEAAASFFAAVVRTGYLLTFIKLTETTVGILLLSNRFVPLALAIIAPVVLNILAYHVFLSPSPVGFIFLALEVYLAWTYRDAYRPMLEMRHA